MKKAVRFFCKQQWENIKLYLRILLAIVLKDNIFDKKYPQYLSYCYVLKYVRAFKFKSQEEFEEYVKKGNLPKYIPSNPKEIYYERGWWGYNDLIGTEPKDDRCSSL
jgi:hypothetical protein